jgi:hypothetical protein
MNAIRIRNWSFQVRWWIMRRLLRAAPRVAVRPSEYVITSIGRSRGGSSTSVMGGSGSCRRKEYCARVERRFGLTLLLPRATESTEQSSACGCLGSIASIQQ